MTQRSYAFISLTTSDPERIDTLTIRPTLTITDPERIDTLTIRPKLTIKEV